MKRTSSRRDFLKTTAVTGVGFWVGGSLLSDESKSPDEKLNIGIIGCGGKGYSDMRNCSGENIYSICEVDDKRGAEGLKLYPKAKRYYDYREMLEKEAKHLDAVTVSTPDHNHAPASIMAMKMGLGVYCQKPLTHSIYEARLMAETATKYKVATQMGNQGTANDGLRRAAEIIQSGGLGDVREVHVWTNRPVWPQGIDRLATQKVPPHIKWDLWLGPAAWRPYNEGYCPFNWRGWWDFGTGALGDMACHTLNLPYMALKLGYPTAAEASTSGFNEETYPNESTIRFEFPARGDMPALKLYWYDGGRKPPAELFHGKKRPNTGSLLVGSRGNLFSGGDYGANYNLIPEKNFEGYKGPEPWIERSIGHTAEWLRALKTDKPAMSNFADYSGKLTEIILLGNVAMRARHKVEYDGDAMKITNCTESNNFLHREYRKGWVL